MSREAFEKWYTEEYGELPYFKINKVFDWDEGSNSYYNDHVDACWRAWQAAIEYQKEKDIEICRKYAEETKCMCGDEIADQING